jgi:hypothetical protein
MNWHIVYDYLPANPVVDVILILLAVLLPVGLWDFIVWLRASPEVFTPEPDEHPVHNGSRSGAGTHDHPRPDDQPPDGSKTMTTSRHTVELSVAIGLLVLLFGSLAVPYLVYLWGDNSPTVLVYAGLFVDTFAPLYMIPSLLLGAWIGRLTSERRS